MLFNLTELLSYEGFKKELSVEIPIQQIEFAGMNYKVKDKVLTNLTLLNAGSNEVVIEGNVDATLYVPCSRCMEDVTYPIKTDFSRDVKFNEEAEEPYSFINGYYLDIEKLVLDELIINLPMKVLCADDCLGICRQCGVNLNKESCDCETDNIDPRLAGLKDLFNDL